MRVEGDWVLLGVRPWARLLQINTRNANYKDSIKAVNGIVKRK